MHRRWDPSSFLADASRVLLYLRHVHTVTSCAGKEKRREPIPLGHLLIGDAPLEAVAGSQP
jgi:hypothetical protein